MNDNFVAFAISRCDFIYLYSEDCSRSRVPLCDYGHGATMGGKEYISLPARRKQFNMGGRNLEILKSWGVSGATTSKTQGGHSFS